MIAGLIYQRAVLTPAKIPGRPGSAGGSWRRGDARLTTSNGTAQNDRSRTVCALPTLQSALLPKSHSARSGLEYLCSQRPARISGEHGWRTQMKHMTRACSVLVVTAFGWVAAAAPALAQSAPQCVVSGSPPAGWGFNSIGYIQIASGSSCRFSVNITGEILSSAVSQNPAHGTLQQLDAASFVYTSQAGYNGSDTFAVQATGKSPTSSGVSVITINASLQ